MKVYVIEGQYGTDFEGMTFAICTTKEKAEKAMSMSVGYEEGELMITEIIADTIKINDEIIDM